MAVCLNGVGLLMQVLLGCHSLCGAGNTLSDSMQALISLCCRTEISFSCVCMQGCSCNPNFNTYIANPRDYSAKTLAVGAQSLPATARLICPCGHSLVSAC